ncbi:rho GTPase-activating protein 21-like [Glandiceps talaboti]
MASKYEDSEKKGQVASDRVSVTSEIIDPLTGRTGPRTITLNKHANGFGFTLRHFIVYPPESAIAELTKDEIVDSDSEGHKKKRSKICALEPMDTIFVRQVKEGGPAEEAGLSTGDRIVSVNGETVTGKTYSQVVALIQGSDSTLTLLVVPRDEDVLQMAYSGVAYNQSKTTHRGSASDIPRPPVDPYTKNNNNKRESSPSLSSSSSSRSTSDEPRNRSASDSKFKSEANMQFRLETGVTESSNTVLRRGSYDDPGARRIGRSDTRGMSSHGSGSSIVPSKGVDTYNNAQDSKIVAAYSHPPKSKSVSDSRLDNNWQPSQLPVRTNRINTVPPSRSMTTSTSVSSSMNSRQLSSTSAKSKSGSTSALDLHSVRQSDNNDAGQRHFVHGDSDSEIIKQRHRSEIRYQPAEKRGPNDGVPAERAFATSAYFTKPTTLPGNGHRPRGGSLQEPLSRPHHADYSQRNVTNHKSSTHKSSSDSLSSGEGNFYKIASKHSSQHQEAPPTSLDKVGRGRSASADMLVIPEGHHREEVRGRISARPLEEERIRYKGDDRGRRADTRARRSDRPSRARSQDRWGDRHMTVFVNYQDDYNQNVRNDRQRNRDRRAKTEVQQLSTGGMSMREYLTKQKSSKQEPKGQTDIKRNAVTVSPGSVQSSINVTLSPNEGIYPEPTESPRGKENKKYTARIETSFNQKDNWIQPNANQVRRTENTLTLDVQKFRTDADGSTSSLHTTSSKDSKEKDSRGFELRRAEPVQVILIDGEDGHNKHGNVRRSGNKHEHQPIIMQSDQGHNQSQPRARSEDKQIPQSQSQSWSQPTQRGRGRDPSPRSDRRRESSPRQNEQQTVQSATAGNVKSTRGAMRRKTEILPAKHDKNAQQKVQISKECPPVPVRDDSRDRMRERLRGARLRARSEDRDFRRHYDNRDYQRTRRHPTIIAAVGRLDDATSSSSGSRKSSTTTEATSPSPTSDSASAATRMMRRTSYLMATASEEGEEQQHVLSASSPDTESEEKSSPSPTGTTDRKTPYKKNPSIKKLKSFFGEGTPKIVEASEKSKVNNTTTTCLYEVIREGPLYCKVEAKDRKRATDRSWKLVHGVLKGHILYLSKEKKDGTSMSPTSLDDHPISIKSAIVDIAYDYTKKKNVFRLCTYNGSEYLLQASDTKTMLAWISVIQANNNPDSDEVGVESLIVRKSALHDNLLSVPPPNKHPVSPSTHRKKFSLRSASPGPHGRKSLKDKDEISPKEPKSKQHNWKGKISRISKKFGPGSGTAEGEPVAGTFGVLLETCPPSQNNEYIPLVVDICCNIVETNGLEVIGIYRVPGNTSGVTQLQDECNKGMEDVNLQDKRWNDINVVSSLLKLFFRKLPDPIVPSDQYAFFIEANRKDDPTTRMSFLRKLVHELPPHHRETLQFLACHLKKVAENGNVNKMEARNLAIVFGPTLVRPAEESMVTMVTDMSDQCRIVESIIIHCDWFFSSDEADSVHVPVDSSTSVAPSSNMGLLLSKVKQDEENKERKRKGKKAHVVPDDDEDFGFNERNIDFEISVRMKRHGMSHKLGQVVNVRKETSEMTEKSSTTSTTTTMTTTTTTKRSESEERLADTDVQDKSRKLEIHERKSSVSSAKTGSQSSLDVKSTTESEGHASSDPEATEKAMSYIRATKEAFQRNQYRAESKTTAGSRKYSTDSDSSSNSQQWSQREKEDFKSELKKGKEGIERLHHLAILDYESEDSKSVEDLYKAEDFAMKVSDISSKIASFSKDYESESYGKSSRTDGSSVTSDYSTVSSTTFRMSELRTPDTPGESDTIVGKLDTKLDSDNLMTPDSDNDSDLLVSMTATFDQKLKMLLNADEELEREKELEITERDISRADGRSYQKRLRVSKTDTDLERHLETRRMRTSDSRSSLDDAQLSVSRNTKHGRNKKDSGARRKTDGNDQRPPTIALPKQHNSTEFTANKTSPVEINYRRKHKSRGAIPPPIQTNQSSEGRDNEPGVGHGSDKSQTVVTLLSDDDQIVLTKSRSPQLLSPLSPSGLDDRSPSPPKTFTVTLTLEKKNDSQDEEKENSAHNEGIGKVESVGFNQDEKDIFRKRTDKCRDASRARRRHTWGGGKDLKDYKKLLALHMNGSDSSKDQKSSALERLKPFGLEMKDLESKTVQAWLRHQKSGGDLYAERPVSDGKFSETVGNWTGFDKPRVLKQRSYPIVAQDLLTTSIHGNYSGVPKKKGVDAHPQNLSAKPKFYDIESYL